MKKNFLKVLQYLLKIFAKLVLKKYQPDVIGITGSVGKTNAKEAIYTVLHKKFTVRKNLKNYNNELGVPLTIIGQESGGKNPWQWLKVFGQFFKLILFIDKNYPEILVLEMGADKLGDIEYLVKMAKPKISVVTAVAPAHLEFFGTLGNVIKEKSALVKCLTKNDWAILNYDDQAVRDFAKLTKSRVINYGFSENCDVSAQEMKIICDREGRLCGTAFKILYKGNLVPVFISDVLGQPPIYAVLAAAAVGIIYDLNLLEIAKALEDFLPAKSRLHLLPGIKNTWLIDDTYNSSPKACLEAIKILSEFPQANPGKRWAVLGDMLELGNYTEEAHQSVGREIAELKNIDYLVTIGERAKDIKKGALEKGVNGENIFSFNNISEAGLFLRSKINENDIVLIKGSQGMRLEKITKEIMAEPGKAQNLLCRQGEEWLNK